MKKRELLHGVLLVGLWVLFIGLIGPYLFSAPSTWLVLFGISMGIGLVGLTWIYFTGGNLGDVQ